MMHWNHRNEKEPGVISDLLYVAIAGFRIENAADPMDQAMGNIDKNRYWLYYDGEKRSTATSGRPRFELIKLFKA